MFTKYYAIWAGTCIIVIRVKYVVEFREREREREGWRTIIACMYLWEICVENERVMNTCWMSERRKMRGSKLKCLTYLRDVIKYIRQDNFLEMKIQKFRVFVYLLLTFLVDYIKITFKSDQLITCFWLYFRLITNNYFIWTIHQGYI